MFKKFTPFIFRSVKLLLVSLAAVLLSFSGNSQVLINEGFNVATPLPAGWAQQNLSAPMGIQPIWFQGNATVFPGNSGGATSYIAANFQNTAGAGTISNWLFTPSVPLKDGDLFSFYTRGTGGGFADRLQVRLSIAGTSVDAGATATSTGDFSNLLLDINPTLNPFGFPDVWTQYTVTISGVGTVATPGRIAFRYFVENGGPDGSNSDFIGVDDVMYTSFTGPCAGAPTPGNTIASSPTVCAATNFTLSIQNNPFVSGLTYQWQSSPDNVAWTNITGATQSTLTTQQSAPMWYRALVNCGPDQGTSTPVQVNMSPGGSCYCIAGTVNTAFEKISNVSLNTINNSSSSTAGYEDFTTVTTTLEPGRAYPMSVTISGGFAADQVVAWIDYNQNGSFTDAGETIMSSPLGVGPHSTVVIVPFTALSGPTRMRIRLHDTSDGPNATSCGNANWGQVEDYVVNILPSVPCSGVPVPGNTLSTANAVCAGAPFTLTLQNFTSGSGIMYQWQSSPDGTAWTNIAGATSQIYTTTLPGASTYYRAVVTCGASEGNSNSVQVMLNPPTECYCVPPPTNCGLSDVITNVTLNTLNNNSGCATPSGYTNYVPTVAATDVIRGAANTMRVTVGPGGTEYVGVWIDYNVDGVFDASEFTLLGSGNGSTITGTVSVPASAPTGITRMRVRVRYNTTLTGAQSCLAYAFGETEDYAVNIIPCVQGSITTQPVNRTIGCSGSTTFSVAAVGSLLTYQWEYRVNATSPWQLVTNTAPYSGANTATLTLTDAPSTLNGYQYRVLYSGACTAPDVSNAVTLTVGPLVGTVVLTPTSGSICQGGFQQMSITNTAPPTTTTFSSGAVSLAIPDNNLTGMSTVMPVSIPAGAIVTNMAVTLNINHTWAGDLAVVLRAPNGAILNLDYFISATGPGPSTGLSNTVISSQGTALLSSGSNPWTGTFRADAVVTPAAGNPPAGPAALLPTVNNWGALYSIPNGDWTLGVMDAFAGDAGTITSWSITVTYGAPSTGIWTPATGLFTDATGTTPYVAGTPVSTVYASPATSTTYSVVVSNPLCTAAPVSIPVTVSTALSDVNLTDNVSSCDGGSTTITATPTEGNIITTQWQVSTDGGATFTNITDGGIYSNATTSTLSISEVPGSANGYQYRAIVSNPCNSVTTDATTITVNPNPTIQITGSPYSALMPGLTTTLNTTVSPNAGANYTWYLNGIAIPGGTQPSIAANVDALGDYTVMVEDVNGCTSTSSAFTLRDSASSVVFIYPSPNTGQFQVRFHSTAGNVLPRMVNIYDSKGSRIFSRSYPVGAPYQRMDIDISRHGKGIYMVELADRLGTRIKAGRVIVL